jgi:hypothetical protein
MKVRYFNGLGEECLEEFYAFFEDKNGVAHIVAHDWRSCAPVIKRAEVITSVEMDEAEYERIVGRPPEQDDLERATCDTAGGLGCFSCGWDFKEMKPSFMTGHRQHGHNPR